MTRPVEVALMLMRMALALLDAAGEGFAAAQSTPKKSSELRMTR